VVGARAGDGHHGAADRRQVPAALRVLHQRRVLRQPLDVATA
jgi:hypothetical protein